MLSMLRESFPADVFGHAESVLQLFWGQTVLELLHQTQDFCVNV